MSRSKASIETVLDPVRDIHLAQLNAEMLARQKTGDLIATEVIRRDRKGRVLRDGVLNLPSRDDFSVKSSKGVIHRDLKGGDKVQFDPIQCDLEPSLSLKIHPFTWDNLRISFDSEDDAKRLLRLRLWFLEWFQTRHLDCNDVFSGVVHSIHGPERDGKLWHVTIDMGSAPAHAFVELLRVLASRGVSSISLGAELDSVPSNRV